MLSDLFCFMSQASPHSFRIFSLLSWVIINLTVVSQSPLNFPFYLQFLNGVFKLTMWSSYFVPKASFLILLHISQYISKIEAAFLQKGGRRKERGRNIGYRAFVDQLTICMWISIICFHETSYPQFQIMSWDKNFFHQEDKILDHQYSYWYQAWPHGAPGAQKVFLSPVSWL